MEFFTKRFYEISKSDIHKITNGETLPKRHVLFIAERKCHILRKQKRKPPYLFIANLDIANSMQ